MHSSLLACVLATVTILITSSQAKETCGHKPADIVFLLDSSASIAREDFSRQLRFVADVVSMFDISPTHTRIGVVSFSNWAFIEFHLAAYSRSSDVTDSVLRIQQIRGDTNTAAGLHYARTAMFQPERGARYDVPHVAIVLTDGKSNQPRLTKLEAARAHAQGIHVFAIGIGSQVDRYELRAIGSSPDETYIFHVPDYKALHSIQDLLVIKTCGVTETPTSFRPSTTTTPATTTPPPTTTEPMSVDQACGEAAIADIVFATSPSGSARNTRKAVAFYRKLARGLDIGPDRVRVAMVPKECDTVSEVDLRHFEEKSDVLERLNEMQVRQRTTAGALRYMRKDAYAPENGGRPNAKRIGVIIVDEADTDEEQAIKQAIKARTEDGVELFVIGVGKGLSPDRLNRMATEPTSQHVYHVSNYNELARMTNRLGTAICPVIGL